MRFHLQSAAKVNLTLDILGQRADGYHELASVVHTIGIWDEIEVEFTENPTISFNCNQVELEGDDNLCVRAVKVWNTTTDDSFGAQIRLEKHIPTGAGLGGGSGNAAAMLLALNSATKTPLSQEAIREIGAKLGADVPLFLDGGAVLMEGIGEKLTPLKPLSGWLLVVKPKVSFATPSIYRAWDAGQFKSHNDTPRLLEIWPHGDLEMIATRLGNDLERAALKTSDLPAQLFAILRQCGALGAQMSGSGSACFGIFKSEIDAKGARDCVEQALAKLVPLQNSQLFVAPFSARGVRFLNAT